MKAYATIAIALLAGCASVAPQPSYWVPSEQWWAAAASAGGALERRNGTPVEVSALAAKTVLAVNNRLAAVIGQPIGVALVELGKPAAFTGITVKEAPVAILSLELLREVYADPDALAFVLAHEWGHVRLKHQMVNLDGSGVWGTRGSGQEAELAADRYAMRLITRAGFSPCGLYRLMKVYGTTRDHLERAQLAHETNGRRCGV